MRLSSYATVAATFISASALCFVAAGFAVTLIEDSSKTGVRRELDKASLGWADADANGLQLFLIGTAPSEAERFKAITTAGKVVDAARVIDQMEVADREAYAPPRFSLEILRNGSGVSLIGLMPASSTNEDMFAEINEIAGGDNVSDLLETASYPAPEGWAAALELGLYALNILPRSKISIDAGNVSVTAMADSAESKRTLEERLRRRKPSSVNLSVNISAPRPVITPFTLRFVLEDGSASFDACSADTAQARDQILAAARNAGLDGDAAECDIGLGVPSKQWARAAELAIATLDDLGGGSLTFSDADVSLIAIAGTDQTLFDRKVGELETALPEVFALHAVLPVPVDASQGPPEFTATLSPEGQVQLRGRIGSELSRETADSYAKARFGSDVVYTAARIDEALPRDWSVRVLAGIEVLSKLSNGAIRITPDELSINGVTGDPDAQANIARLLAEKLGEAENFDIAVEYNKKLDPVLGLPTPEECELQLAEAQVGRKISFEPGSDTLDASAKNIMDDIADILKKCEDIKLEISGHTDSQGRETMNQQLSQGRAQAVLNALRERRILTSSFTVKGYGEEKPIADNSTEEGREANRRIEFKLLLPEPVAEETSTLDELSENGQDTQTNDDAANADTDAATEGATDEQN